MCRNRVECILIEEHKTQLFNILFFICVYLPFFVYVCCWTVIAVSVQHDVCVPLSSERRVLKLGWRGNLRAKHRLELTTAMRM